jgi:cardiolipin synthase
MKKITTKNRAAIRAISPVDKNRCEQIFSSGDSHYRALLQDIAEAQHSIDFETYIFSNDEAGQRVVTALIAAIQRGVRVRVIVDGVGSPFWGYNLARKLERAGGETKIYNPYPWQIWNWQRSTRQHWWLLKWLFFLFEINTRNHRKTVIIDNHIAYIGSFNVHKCHLPRDQGGFGWRDTSVRISETDLSDLKEAFEDTWNHRSIRERLREAFQRLRENPRFRLNTTRFRRRILFKNLLRRLRRCQQRIWITSAYFIPSNALLRRLKEAARRGIDVRLLVPQRSDVRIVDWASRTYYRSLLKAGVRIFEYGPSVLHAKSIIVDDWMVVGSTNLNSRSLIHDLEIDAEIQTEHAKQDLSNLYITDLRQSREITPQGWHKRFSLLKRLAGMILMRFRYFM